jgi:uncharacterized protein (TIGR03435 family)
MRIRTIGKALVLAMAVSGIAALSVAQSAQKPQFEVASVKPYVKSSSGPMDFSGFGAQPGGRFRVAGVNLKALISYAYRLNQIIGGSDWTLSDQWEITAKASEGSIPVVPKSFDPAVPDTMAQMVQALIEERFQLKSHREMRELPVYNLAVAKSGKLKLSQDQTPVDPTAPKTPSLSGPARGSLRNLGKPSPTALTMVLSGTAVRMDEFMGMLGQFADRPLIDKTGLSGLYDFELQFDMAYPATNAPVRASQLGMSSLFTDLQDQLGLKLESAKAQLEVLVIDSVQRPTEN